MQQELAKARLVERSSVQYLCCGLVTRATSLQPAHLISRAELKLRSTKVLVPNEGRCITCISDDRVTMNDFM